MLKVEDIKHDEQFSWNTNMTIMLPETSPMSRL